MIATLSKKLIEKLTRKSYRDEYVAENVKTGIAYQIRALRDQRGWSQKVLATAMDKPQSVVSRMEDPDYGKLTVQSLLEVAAAFDVALLVKFVSLPDMINKTRDVSPKALEAVSFDKTQLVARTRSFEFLDQAAQPKFESAETEFWKIDLLTETAFQVRPSTSIPAVAPCH